MNGYTKLFGSILASSVWGETKETKIVWVTMLAMADKKGEVAGSIPGLATLARLTLAETQEALAVLSAPDPYSRTKAFEGRRIRDIDGGWKIINHQKYRNAKKADERREYLRDKKRESRQKQRLAASNAVSGASLGANKCDSVSGGKVDTSRKPNDDRDLGNVAVNNCQQKSTSQQQAKAEAKAKADLQLQPVAMPLLVNANAGEEESSKPRLIDLALIPWGDAVRLAESVAAKYPPVNAKERRAWFKCGAVAAAMLGEGWLAGAMAKQKNSKAGPRKSAKAQLVGILNATAKEEFGVDFAAVREQIEIPADVWNSAALGGPKFSGA